MKIYTPILGILCLALAIPCKAQPDTNKQKAPIPSTKTQINDIYSVQHFPLLNSAGLFIEFRYVNQQLKYIYFWNTSINPLKFSIQDQDQVFKPNEDATFKAPRGEQFKLRIYPPLKPASTKDNDNINELEQISNYTYVKASNGYYQVYKEVAKEDPIPTSSPLENPVKQSI